MYGYDPARTRYLPVKDLDPPFGASLWSFQAGKLLEFQPIVVHGTIYFMDKDGTFYALNVRRRAHRVEAQDRHAQRVLARLLRTAGSSRSTSSRSRRWRSNAKKKARCSGAHPLPGRSESSPLVHDGKVIFGCESGDIFALDAKTGKMRWTVHTGGAVKGALALDHGTLFADNYAGEVWAIDAGNGHVKWTAHTQGGGFLHGGGVYSTPAVAFGRVYLGGLDGRVYSFVEKTGELAWSHSTGRRGLLLSRRRGHAASPPTVFIGSEDKHFYALDAKTGAVRWEHSIDGIVLGSPSVVGPRPSTSRGSAPTSAPSATASTRGKKVFNNERGRVQPGHLGRQEDLPDGHLDHQGVQAPDQGRAETPAPSQAHEGGEPKEARLEAPRRQGQAGRVEEAQGRRQEEKRRQVGQRPRLRATTSPAGSTEQPPPEAAAGIRPRVGDLPPLRVDTSTLCRQASNVGTKRSLAPARLRLSLRYAGLMGMPALRRWSFAWRTV